jgi:hypothetical protein
VTNQMLVAFGGHGITSIEDLAACATDDLDGWSESKDGKTIRHAGALDRECEELRRCSALRSQRISRSNSRLSSNSYEGSTYRI